MKKKIKLRLYKFNLTSGPLSVDRYAEIDDDVDVEQCSDSEIRNRQQSAQTSLASPSCASDDERLTPEQISVSEFR